MHNRWQQGMKPETVKRKLRLIEQYNRSEGKVIKPCGMTCNEVLEYFKALNGIIDNIQSLLLVIDGANVSVAIFDVRITSKVRRCEAEHDLAFFKDEAQMDEYLKSREKWNA